MNLKRLPHQRIEQKRPLAQARDRIASQEEGRARRQHQRQKRPRAPRPRPSESTSHDSEQQTSDDKLTSDVVKPAAEHASNVGRNLRSHRLGGKHRDEHTAACGDAEPNRLCAPAGMPHHHRESRTRHGPGCQATAD